MKNIIIVGKNSYIGKNLIELLEKDREDYNIIEYDSLNMKIEEMDFTGADCVFHVTGIAHVSYDPDLKEKFLEINRDLAIKSAKKAKADGARQFIFMSSMIIYGDKFERGNNYIIDKDTPYNPNDYYGQSKYEADIAIQELKDDNFKIAIIRSSMVFGKDCKGNFPIMVKFARKSFIFPNFKNERSMIYIENLTNIIKLIIDNQSDGIFFPQNKDYFSTSEIVKYVAEFSNKKIWMTKIFNPLIFILIKVSTLFNKVFGNKVYNKELSSHFNYSYCKYNNKESIYRSLGCNDEIRLKEKK